MGGLTHPCARVVCCPASHRHDALFVERFRFAILLKEAFRWLPCACRGASGPLFGGDSVAWPPGHCTVSISLVESRASFISGGLMSLSLTDLSLEARRLLSPWGVSAVWHRGWHMMGPQEGLLGKQKTIQAHGAGTLCLHIPGVTDTLLCTGWAFRGTSL